MKNSERGGKKRDEFLPAGACDHSAVGALRANCDLKSEQIEARRFGHCVLLLLEQVLIHPRLVSNFKYS